MAKLDEFYTEIETIGRQKNERLEAKKIINKISYSVKLIKKQADSFSEIDSVFISNTKAPYFAFAKNSLQNELMELNKLSNIFSENNSELVELQPGALKASDVKLILLPEGAEEAALELSAYTEHALTVFVDDKLFSSCENISLLPDYFRQMNKKIRRDEPENDLTKRDEASYL